MTWPAMTWPAASLVARGALYAAVALAVAYILFLVALRELAVPSGMAPGSLAALFLAAIPENLGYRQIRNLWLIAGFFGAPAMETRKKQ